MKRVSLFLAILMFALAIVPVLSVGAADEVLERVEKYATYTDPMIAADAENTYADAEGEQRLFDGVIPTIADMAEHGKQWFKWNGWIASAYTIDAAFVKNEKVKYDFTFSQSVDLKKMVLHVASMPEGSVGTPSKVELFLSNDGQVWDETPIASAAGSDVKGGELLETITIELDKAESTKYVRLVATRGTGAESWFFMSEVEIYEAKTLIVDESSEDASETSSEAPASSSSTGTTPTGDAGFMALAIILILSGAAAVIVKKIR